MELSTNISKTLLAGHSIFQKRYGLNGIGYPLRDFISQFVILLHLGSLAIQTELWLSSYSWPIFKELGGTHVLEVRGRIGGASDQAKDNSNGGLDNSHSNLIILKAKRGYSRSRSKSSPQLIPNHLPAEWQQYHNHKAVRKRVVRGRCGEVTTKSK